MLYIRLTLNESVKLLTFYFHRNVHKHQDNGLLHVYCVKRNSTDQANDQDFSLMQGNHVKNCTNYLYNNTYEPDYTSNDTITIYIKKIITRFANINLQIMYNNFSYM